MSMTLILQVRQDKYAVKGQVKERIDATRYRVAYPSGKHKVYDYETIVNLVNKPDDDDAPEMDI